MSNKDGELTTKTPFVVRTIRELKVTFVTAVTMKQQRVLLQQGNRRYGDGQHMECEGLTDIGQIVEDSIGHSDTESTGGTV